MRGALAMALAGSYMGCLYMAIQSTVFYGLSIFVAGVIIGIVANDCVRSLHETHHRDPEPTPQERPPDNDPEKTRRVMKIKQMLDRKIWCHSPLVWFYSKEAKDYVKGLGPEVLNLRDDELWAVVNEGENYAFRNPAEKGRTIVMRKDFAERALVLGGLP